MYKCTCTRRGFLKVCGLGLAALSVPTFSCGAGRKKKPNFLFLFTDDQTFRSINALNNPEVKTPNIDRLLKGKKKRLHDAIYGSYRDFQRMVRTEDYKLIVYPKANRIQLFDIKNDPWEKNNLADNPKYAPKIKQLKAKLKELQKQVGDTLDLENTATPAKRKK